MKKIKQERTYFDRVHTWGRMWTIGAILVFLSLPLAICVHFDAWPQLSRMWNPILKVIALYWTTAVVEVLAYIPMMGGGATYLSFVSGNISNLKLPCALASMENAKVSPNSDEGEAISTIAVGVSAITTTVIIAAGVLLFSPVIPKLTAEGSLFKPAFTYVLPALFGSIGAGYLAKHWRIAIAPVVVGVLLLFLSPTLNVGTLIFPTIVAAVVAAVLIYYFQNKEEAKALLQSLKKKKNN